MTELDAVNEMIEALGEDPVLVLPGPSGSVEALAQTFLLRQTKRILMKGWNLNRVKRTLTAADPIVLSGVLGIRIIPESPLDIRLALKNGNLFNLDDETEAFTVDVTLDLILEVPFTELPESLAEYVIKDAALKLLRQKRPSSVSIPTIFQELIEARADWVRIDKLEANHNMFATFHIQEAKGQRRRYDSTFFRNRHL